MSTTDLKLSDLVPDPENPRTMSSDNEERLLRMMAEYGDLANPTYNRTLKKMVGGHQRVRLLKRQYGEAAVSIRKMAPDDYQLVVTRFEGDAAPLTFPLRVVDWDEAKHRAAMVAANSPDVRGEYDAAKMRDVFEFLGEGYDVDLLGLSPENYEEWSAPEPADKNAEAPNDEAPAVDPALVAKWAPARGGVWDVLDKDGVVRHRVMCGDSESDEDVALLLDGAKPKLCVSDPPYGVNYDPKWRERAGVSKGTMMMGKVTNDDRADFSKAWALAPADVFYLYCESLHCDVVKASLAANKVSCRSLIIWNKQRFALGRGHYHWKHETCQPAGTMVEKVIERRSGSQRSITELVPIESLADGDLVVSWNGVVVKRRGAKVKVASRHYDGHIHEVSVGGLSTKTTHSHHWSIRISSRPSWVTYLMRRGSRWRVGRVQSFNTRGFGPSIRLKDENGEAVWILSVHETFREAMVFEQAISVRYGIPTTHWEIDKHSKPRETLRQHDDIEKIYQMVGPLEDKAISLLTAYGRHVDLPLATNEGIRGGSIFFSRRNPTIVRSCNLIPGLMEVPKPTDAPRSCEPNSAGREGWEWVPITSVSRQDFSGMVYSLDVSADKHYLADGLITHNCWYAVRDGGNAAWIGGRDKCTVWDIKNSLDIADSNEDEKRFGHGTQKPVECMARPMRHHEGDAYDPFAGSGTTLVAAHHLGRKSWMMEIDPDYCAVILERASRLGLEVVRAV